MHLTKQVKPGSLRYSHTDPVEITEALVLSGSATTSKIAIQVDAMVSISVVEEKNFLITACYRRFSISSKNDTIRIMFV